MNVKRVVSGDGSLQVSQTVIPLEGSGGELGKKADLFLTRLIESIKKAETEQQVVEYYYIICGYGICCKECGFLTEKSLEDLMHLVEHIVDLEMDRTGASGKG